MSVVPASTSAAHSLLIRLSSLPSVSVPSAESLLTKLNTLLRLGPSSLSVTIDFDRTITSGTSCSAHGVLENIPSCSEEFAAAAKANTEKYFPIEIDPKLTVEEKVPFMREWYGKNHKLMAGQNFTLDQVRSSLRQPDLVTLRPGALDFLEKCEYYKIPVCIFSAGVADVIEEILNHVRPKGNAHTTKVYSNRMIFNTDGECNGFTEPLIHMFNKNQSALSPDERRLYETPCRLLVGDGYGDRTMCDGSSSPAELILKIGFLNNNVELNLPKYSEAFDLLILDDASFDAIMTILDAYIDR